MGFSLVSDLIEITRVLPRIRINSSGKCCFLLLFNFSKSFELIWSLKITIKPVKTECQKYKKKSFRKVLFLTAIPINIIILYFSSGNIKGSVQGRISLWTGSIITEFSIEGFLPTFPA